MLTATWTDDVQAIGAAVSGLGVIGAISYAALQTRALFRQVQLQQEQQERALLSARADQYMRLSSFMLGWDRLLIDNPDLRAYFYDDEAVPEERHMHDRVMSAAEYLLDIADLVANHRRHGQLDDFDYKEWPGR